MKKSHLIFFTFLLSYTFFTSCKKEVRTIYQIAAGDSSRISITNASPAISSLQFYLNNKLISLPDSPVSFGKTVYVPSIRNATTYSPDTVMFPYINIKSGYQQLGFGSYGNNNILGQLNNNFEPNASYSLFLTDTVIHGRVTPVLLKDNIKTTGSAVSQIRFLNLSPDAPPLDIWAYPNAGYVGYKIFSGCAYLPDDYNSYVNAESFSMIDAGTYYFEARASRTSGFVLGGFLVISGQSIITIYTRGYFGGIGVNAIDVSVIQYKQ